MVAAINAKAKARAKPVNPKTIISAKEVVITRKAKRTSIGGRFAPLNKSKRRNWKRYRGQGKRQ